MLTNPGEKATVHVIEAGDLYALERKINELLADNPAAGLADVSMSQIQVPGRAGNMEPALVGLVVLSTPK